MLFRFILPAFPLLAILLLAACRTQPAASPNPAAANNNIPIVAAPASTPVTPPPALTDQQIKDRCEELGYIAMRGDAAARNTILAELRNPVFDIRKSALSAAIQLNDRSIVPGMRAVVDATTNLEEKVDLLKAIDYINLPSLTEYRAALRKAKETGRPFSLPGATPLSVTNDSSGK